MNWLDKMNEAICYVEDNLTGEIDFDEAAIKACCSTYHFQRMFSFITDVPLSEYIRRRRLTLAAFELQNRGVKVIDLAFKYGYESPDAFTRAFQNLHGVTPTSARDMGIQLKAYPRISFHISIKGDMEMNYRIEEKESFSVFGVDTIVSKVDGKCYEKIPSFWLKSIKDGTMERILKAADCRNPDMLLNAAMYGHQDDGTYHYMLCQKTPQKGIPEGFVELDIPKLTWAIFPTEEHTEDKTSEKVQAIWERIYPEWFPSSGYQHADAPEFEMYYKVGDNKFIVEIWIPVYK
ncbi:GyrI-like domain-containing protein [Clostridium sp. BNL1100]|uniref:AraC family transcriptional regulator n=1 Tax=Clostridium sp. BNL1100 TaxID=755731 RepID=UPI00024A7C4C|nr:GyrI-like domain-containing protein [Clostridium sp. BNL1100]AEY64480.1 hypothetical protein Clo1100_0189 [Clostridium sp. BNL1100]